MVDPPKYILEDGRFLPSLSLIISSYKTRIEEEYKLRMSSTDGDSDPIVLKSNVNGATVANELRSGMSVKRMFPTLHEDRDGKLLKEFKERCVTLHNEEGSLQYLRIGNAEQSDASKARCAADPSVPIDWHRHLMFHLNSKQGMRWLAEEIWNKLPTIAAGGSYDGGGIRWLVQRGTDEEARDYAMKEEPKGRDFEGLILGEPRSVSTNQGKRNDIEDFKADVRSGACPDMITALENHSLVYGKFPNLVVDYLQLHAPHVNRLPADYRLRKWQKFLLDYLKTDPDDRTVVFQVDEVGNSGKSWFCKHLKELLPGKFIQRLRPGRSVDMAKELDIRADVIVVDVPREVTHDESKKILQYRIFEEIKDGEVSSTKYFCVTKIMKPCHVIVFMNAHPHRGVLSEDRMLVCEMTPELNEFHEEPDAPDTHGPEFSSDDSGDGPEGNLSEAASNYLKQVNGAKKKPPAERNLVQTTIHPITPLRGRRYDLGPNTPGGKFWNWGMIGRKVLVSKYLFTVNVSTNSLTSAPGLFDYCCDRLGWDGAGSLELTIDFSLWPTDRETFTSQIDMLDGTEGQHPRHMYPDGSVFRLVSSTGVSNLRVGDSRDCWGNEHAMQRHYGNYEGNPNKRPRTGECASDYLYAHMCDSSGPEDVYDYMNVIALMKPERFIRCYVRYEHTERNGNILRGYYAGNCRMDEDDRHVTEGIPRHEL